VVEFEAEGKKRWVDTTFKDQGGGPFNRFIPDYELGLPVEASVTGLVKPPPNPEQSNLYKLHENFLLATSGEASLLAVTLQAEGNQADILRYQLKRTGVEELAKQRLQFQVNRFGNASRIGLLKHQDDRLANRMVLAEVFEVRPALGAHPNPKLCRFQTPSQWVGRVLAMPDKTARRTPFSLPHPCLINYVFDVDSPSIQRLKLRDPRSLLGNKFVHFRCESRAGRGFFVMNLSLTTKVDSVPTDEVEKYRQLVEQIWRSSNWELSLPKGYSRSRQRSGFGELPVAPAKIPPPLPVPAAPVQHVQAAVPDPEVLVPVKRRRKAHEESVFLRWLFFIGAVIILLGVFVVCLSMARRPP